jgi:hypothetical protein
VPPTDTVPLVAVLGVRPVVPNEMLATPVEAVRYVLVSKLYVSAAVFFKKPAVAPVIKEASAEIDGPTTFLIVTFEALLADQDALNAVSTVVFVAPAVELAAPKVPSLTVEPNWETNAIVPERSGIVNVLSADRVVGIREDV